MTVRAWNRFWSMILHFGLVLPFLALANLGIYMIARLGHIGTPRHATHVVIGFCGVELVVIAIFLFIGLLFYVYELD